MPNIHESQLVNTVGHAAGAIIFGIFLCLQGLRFILAPRNAGRIQGVIDCSKAFSTCPPLILHGDDDHGDDDQTLPIRASALPSSKIVKVATLKIYAGAPHGTYKDRSMPTRSFI